MGSQQSSIELLEIMKADLLELFGALHAGQIDLFRLNFGEIILFSKVNEG
jgi:hypothetical protein